MTTHISKPGSFTLFVCLLAMMAFAAAAQPPATKTPPKSAPPKPAPKAEPAEHPEPPAYMREHRGGSEKALAVDPNVNIKLPCISQARVTVNGWQRDEVRVFVKNGSDISFKVHEKDPKSGKPVWILITQQMPGVRTTPLSECLSGDRIDIEVPYGATLSITGRETETRIDSVKKVSIKNLGGNVALRNISGGIAAETYEGDVSVESSGGQIALKTSTGNIIAYGVSPGQVGDVFKAGTSNGSITLQKVEHRQIEANSVSGTLVFNGKFLPGGLYAFKTSNGTVRLAIPAESSCKVVAWYGYGSFDSELPIKTLTEDVSKGGKRLSAIMGSGDAQVNLTTSSGRLLITKQEPENPKLKLN